MDKATQYFLADIKDLIPYARNARIHDETQVAQIAASIKEFGFLSLSWSSFFVTIALKDF